LLISLAALAVRVAYGLSRDHLALGGDAYFYSVGADLLVAGRGFIEPVTVITPPVEQSASHPPLYLLYLAVASFLDPTSGPTQMVHMLWSTLLGTASVVLCGLVGRKLAGPRCGLLAAAAAAVYPNLWVHDGIVMSETMAIFATVVLLLLAYRYWERPSAARAVGLGLCCGLAALSRAELLLAVPLLLVPLLLFTRQVRFPRRVGWLVAGGAAAAAALSPWVVFNLGRFEEPVVLTHAFGYTIAAANCDATYGGPNIGFKDYGCAHDVAVATQAPGRDPSQRENHVRRETMRYVNDNLDRVPAVVAARLGRIAGVYRTEQDITLDAFFSNRERWVARGIMYGYWAVAPLALIGALVLRRRRVPVFPLASFPAVVLLAVAVTFAQPRYRAPAEAALILLGAVAVDAALRRLTPRRKVPASASADRAERVPVPA
ncbi:MAG: glycosyltransferase family 39 protein, partial [Actinomycetota bacterium]|nr:glycosyltransferase family 39 protein [Actinomycetota bacterium]